jgi:hypothetical protein
MSTEKPSINEVFNTLVTNQGRIMERKRYGHPDYEDEILMLASGFARPSAIARAIRVISFLDRSFDEAMMKFSVLGAKISGGRKVTRG